MDLKLELQNGMVFMQWKEYKFVFARQFPNSYVEHYAKNNILEILSVTDCTSHIEFTANVIDKILFDGVKFKTIQEDKFTITAGSSYIVYSDRIRFQILYTHDVTEFYEVLKHVNIFIKYVHSNCVNVFEHVGKSFNEICMPWRNSLTLLNRLVEENKRVVLTYNKFTASGFIGKYVKIDEIPFKEYYSVKEKGGCPIVTIPRDKVTLNDIKSIREQAGIWYIELQ
jgi:hypothetical protein